VLRFLVRFSAALVLTLALGSTSRPDAAFAEQPDSQGAQSSDKAAAKSEAAEAWDAIKDTKNPALLESFIARYSTTFFAEIAKARLSELKAAAAKPTPAPQAPKLSPMPEDGVIEKAVLYEEDPADAEGRRFDGSVSWRTETIKTYGQADELAARAEVEIASRGFRMTMLLKRNLDPALPASHVIELTVAVSGNFGGGEVANIPGVLMKSNEQARGTPMAGLAVKVTSSFFLVGLSAVDADRRRNLQLLLERAWFDIPMVYGNHRRAIIAIEKGASGDQVFKTLLTAWGQYPDSTQPADSTQSETEPSEEAKHSMPDEWRRTMMGRPKAQ
jgi:hypothetical protein